LKTETEKLALLNEKTAGDYQAFLYDCDGTLADNMGAHKLSYKSVASRYGVDLNTDIIDELAGWPTVLVVKAISEKYGVELPETFASEKSTEFFNEFIDNTKPVEFVAQHLINHAGKIKIGVVSGGSRKTVTKTLTVLGLLPYVEVLVCAGETLQGKPFPDPFLEAARLLNVDPAKCMVFEDGDPGVQAAIAAGMDWVRVDHI